VSSDPTIGRTIGYLGPHGTFTEQAVLSVPDFADHTGVLFGSMPAVLNAVESGEIDLGFVAIENSIEGTVNASIDTLAFSGQLMIQREVVIPISMHLHGIAAAELDAVKQVVSFPHALAQCREWLKANLPHAEQIAANSTADAVRLVSEAADPAQAAIGPQLAGSIYGLSTIASDIQDRKDNETRFVAVASSGVPKITGNDKTSIVIFCSQSCKSSPPARSTCPSSRVAPPSRGWATTASSWISTATSLMKSSPMP